MSDETNEPRENILLVFAGHRIGQKGNLIPCWMPSTRADLSSGTPSKEFRFYGKTAEKHMSMTIGGVYEVPQVIGDKEHSIFPGSAKYLGLWPNQDLRTEWQIEDRTATTAIDIEKRQKKDAADDNFAVLQPFREKYKRLISQNQRAALMAQIIAYITR